MDSIHICSSCGEIYDDESNIGDISRWRRMHHRSKGVSMEHKCKGGFPQAGHFNAWAVNPADVVRALQGLLDSVEKHVAWDNIPSLAAGELLLKIEAAQSVLEGAKSQGSESES